MVNGKWESSNCKGTLVHGNRGVRATAMPRRAPCTGVMQGRCTQGGMTRCTRIVYYQAMPYRAMPYRAMLHRAMLHRAMLHRTWPCYRTWPCHTVPGPATPYLALPHRTWPHGPGLTDLVSWPHGPGLMASRTWLYVIIDSLLTHY